MEPKSVAQMLNDEWRIGIHYFESDTQRAEIKVLFDHDYEWHFLTMEWTHDEIGNWYPCSGYRLYFMGREGTTIVRSWSPKSNYPSVLMESAQIVSEWCALIGWDAE